MKPPKEISEYLAEIGRKGGSVKGKRNALKYKTEAQRIAARKASQKKYRDGNVAEIVTAEKITGENKMTTQTQKAIRVLKGEIQRAVQATTNTTLEQALDNIETLAKDLNIIDFHRLSQAAWDINQYNQGQSISQQVAQTANQFLENCIVSDFQEV